MRSRLGYIKGKKEAWYSLKRNPQRVGKKIRKEILMEEIPNGHLQYLEDMRHTLGFDK